MRLHSMQPELKSAVVKVGTDCSHGQQMCILLKIHAHKDNPTPTQQVIKCHHGKKEITWPE